MQKLLSVLLAAVIALFPLCALGEARQMTMHIRLDETFLPTLTSMVAVLTGKEATQAEKLAETVFKLADGLSSTLVYQENAAAFDISFKGKTLLDFSVQLGDSLFLTSTLLPGKVFADASGLSSANPSAMANPDDTAAVELIRIIETWTATLETTSSSGAFSGDAYDGGANCQSMLVTEQDVSRLTDEFQQSDVFRQICDAIGVQAKDILNQAEFDGFQCLLRLVTDDNDEVVGVSATILRNGEQLFTLSCGIKEGSARLVMGLGLPRENYWYDLTVSHAAQADETIRLSGTAREWAAPRGENFAFTEAFGQPKSTFRWHFDAAGKTTNLQIAGEGIQLSFSAVPAETLMLTTEGLTAIDMADDTAVEKAATTIAIALLQRLVEVLPTELMQLLLQNIL